MKNYTLAQTEKLINNYVSRNGEIHIIDEGSLVYGLVVATAPNCKSAVIKEVFVNEWTSLQNIRLYNKLPKKYQTLINNI